ncbi:hypothetical protein KEM52_004109 [Ascosphaera acerosa]|nr:hypothetical protein KEM52_004109 [Ascosphaera acerosa]
MSVPAPSVSLDAAAANQACSKFATWGLGSKGVSEDWEEDFDFDDDDFENIDEGQDDLFPNDRGPLSPGANMRVPQSIRDSQASVHGQYGQVQELTLLVQELKRLMLQGEMLHLSQDQPGSLWREARAIIHLADFSDEETTMTHEATIAGELSHGAVQPSTGPVSLSPSLSFDSVEAAFASCRNTPAVDRDAIGRDIFNDTDDAAALKTSADFQEVVLGTRPQTSQSPGTAYGGRLAFDTQSLKALVARANAVVRLLKATLRTADNADDSEVMSHNNQRASMDSDTSGTLDDGSIPLPLSRMFVRPIHEAISSVSLFTVASDCPGAPSSAVLADGLQS